MSIRPIDMQVLLPRSQSISNLNQTLVNKGETLIQQTYHKDKKIQEKKATQVNNLNKKDNPLIKNNSNESKRDSSSNTNQSKSSKDKKKKKKQSEIIYSSGKKIDIKV